jgi:hypothetical protein
MPDIYDSEIALLTKYPERIQDHWNFGTPLFAFVQLDPNNKGDVACLTQIREYKITKTPLSLAICDDIRIPSDSHEIFDEMLPMFAEWQRKVDLEQTRKAHGNEFKYSEYKVKYEDCSYTYTDEDL